MTRLLTSSSLLALCILCSTVNAQFVKETFSEPLYMDNFASDKGDWKVMSNADNLFLIQDGEYLLNRKNVSTGYSVFTDWMLAVPSFEIAVQMKLEKSSDKESSAGIIFMAQEDGSGAFVFEFNNQQNYRLKQLVGVNYRLLTGENKNNGWVNSPYVNTTVGMNLIQVRCSNRNYDVYINQHYLFSFTELAYKSGKLGITVGPSSLVRVDSFSVFGPLDSTKKSDTETTPCEEVKARLKEELDVIRKENVMLRDSLYSLKKKSQPQNDKSTTVKPKHLE